MLKSDKSYQLLAVVLIALFSVVYWDLLCGRNIFMHEGTVWYGTFHYYVECLAAGHFPYWNADLMGGTFFYPNLPFIGLLDPTVLVLTLGRILGLPIFEAYIMFYLSKLVYFAIGAYLLFNLVAKNKLAAILAAGALVLTITPQYLRQPGALYVAYLTPLILYFLLRCLESHEWLKRVRFLTASALLFGVSMNVYIPSYELFNLVLFILALFLLRLVDIRPILLGFCNWRLLGALLGAVVIVLLMMAPGLTVYFSDASASGELFPIQRIPLKTGSLKKIMATEVGDEALSDRLSDRVGYFNGYGNIVNVLFPDIFESLPYFASNDMLAEMGGFIGILPLIFAIIGFIYHKSRYRYLAVLLLVVLGLNMFGSNVTHRPYNSVQQAFNFIFPPLQMIDMRETFSPFFQLYLGLLTALGLALISDEEKWKELLTNKYRQILLIIGVVITAKVCIAGYFEGKTIVSDYDAFVLGELGLFVLLIVLSVRGTLKWPIIISFLISAILADLYVFNRYAVKYVLREAAPLKLMIAAGDKMAKSKQFGYFREPMPSPPNMAYGESIIGAKGALSTGYNHSPFSTKRYYDFLTHLPIENQLMLSGVISPIIDFYPSERAFIATSSGEMIKALVQIPAERLEGYLFLEDRQSKPHVSKKLAKLGRLTDYESVSWLDPQNPQNPYLINYRLNSFYDLFGTRLQQNLVKPDGFLSGPEHKITVRGFTPNSVDISVSLLSDGYLYYGDGWSKYWHAYDNGKEIQIQIANYNSKAVFLEKGEHLVRFEFNPIHYKLGLLAYYTGLILSIVIISYLYFRPAKTNCQI